jgi:quercetin dioxygenase-like cupin family protein
MDEVSAVRWGSGTPIGGTPFDVVVSAAQSGGTFALIGATLPPRAHVEGHTHDNEDQITIVIEGTVGVLCDGVRTELGSGDVFFLPRGKPHALWNPTDQPARLLDAYTPAGIEEMFALAGAQAAGEATGDDYARRRELR